jgi:hypothetical protein
VYPAPCSSLRNLFHTLPQPPTTGCPCCGLQRGTGSQSSQECACLHFLYSKLFMLMFGIKGMACGPEPLPSHPLTQPNSPLHGTGWLRPPSLLEEEDYQHQHLQWTMGLVMLEVGGEEEEEREFRHSSTTPMDLCPQEDSAPTLNLLDPA